MCKHSWDRAYIVNYITAVRNQNRTINTNFIDDNNTTDMISRLSCQIILTKKHDGLEVYVP